ncbi:MAG: 3-deoxy-D-manno-octulosonic acid transferase [Deltaproteobacteria bacterium]|nr:3-deoxy-D-manno-octulosonic acid transferase [Deltaproteobacteria bacterium]
MIFFLYNLILLLSLLLLSPIILFKLIFDKRYIIGLSERLGNIPDTVIGAMSGQRPIWFHAASVGEVIASQKLLEGIRERFHDRKLMVSTFTPTGNKAAKEKLKAEGVIFLPLDLPWIVRKVLKKVNPSVLILMETELWPNLIKSAGDMGIPVAVVNGRISDRSYGKYWFISPLLKRVFDNIKAFLMQSDGDARRIVTLGAEPSKVSVTGNIKFDTIVSEVNIPFMDNWGGAVFIAGSTHKGEDAPVIDIYMELRGKYPDLKFILAPRHLERIWEVEGVLIEKGLQYVKRSQVKGMTGVPVLLLDTLGELASFYKYGNIVFMGGSIVPVGGHNLLEPALYGKAVLFGPHTENFRDAARILTESGGGVEVKDAGELMIWTDRLLSDKRLCDSMGDKARQAVLKNRGATGMTLEALSKVW